MPIAPSACSRCSTGHSSPASAWPSSTCWRSMRAYRPPRSRAPSRTTGSQGPRRMLALDSRAERRARRRSTTAPGRHPTQYKRCELRLPCPGGELRLVVTTRETAEVSRLPVLERDRRDLGDRSHVLGRDVCDVAVSFAARLVAVLMLRIYPNAHANTAGRIIIVTSSELHTVASVPSGVPLE